MIKLTILTLNFSTFRVIHFSRWSKSGNQKNTILNNLAKTQRVIQIMNKIQVNQMVITHMIRIILLVNITVQVIQVTMTNL